MSVIKIRMKNIVLKEEGYLLGLFLGDGYSYHYKKHRHYVVEYHLNSKKDKDILQFLCTLLKRINLHPSVFKDRRCN